MSGISVILPDKSTAILPGAPPVGSGHPTDMDLTVVLCNIERLLEQQGKSADAVSREAGHPDAIRNLRRALQTGKGSFNLRTLIDLAQALQTTSVALLRPEGENFRMVAPYPGDQQTLDMLMEQRELIERQIEGLMARPRKQRSGKR